jgi:hypothetical protein
MALTYEPIATTTLGSANSTITFSSIPSTYTDLKLVITLTTTAGDDVHFRLNGDTGTNYSNTNIYGNGTSVLSARATNDTKIRISDTSSSTTRPSLFIIDLFSYAGSTLKTSIVSSHMEKPTLAGTVSAFAGLWRSTAAINSVTVYVGGTMIAGTQATIYGIKAA